ncbi:F-box domain-containing protein [Mycena kentingensis (nom. inval.)]|nr:F-box domain-containing protein [Mycena kentingensis (nom. inval.)]
MAGSRSEYLFILSQNGKGGLTPTTTMSGRAQGLTNLPTEILAHIFVQCLPNLPQKTSAPPSQPLRAANAPLLLARICRSWRAVALGTPWLWNRLCVTHDAPHPPDFINEYAETWLARSGGVLLTVELLNLNWDSCSNWPQFLDILGRHAARIRCMTLEISVAFDIALEKRRWAFPRLEELDIAMYFDEVDPPCPIKTFQNAPVLRRASFYAFPATPDSIILPSTIEEVVCMQYRLSDFSETISAFPNAIRLEFEISYRNDLVEIPPFHHEKVRELRLCDDLDMHRDTGSSPCVPHILAAAALPTLRVLRLDHQDGLNTEVFTAFVAPSSELRELEIQPHFYQHSALIPPAGSPLVALRLWRPMPNFARTLGEKLGDPEFMSKLEELFIHSPIVPTYPL